MRILFTIAIGVDDRPQRWQHVYNTFSQIAKLFKRAGIQSDFAIHPIIKAPHKPNIHICHSHDDLITMLNQNKYAYAFIWGGNINADRDSVNLFKDYNIQPVFAELGWFPQSEGIYFDFEGTNFRSSIQKFDLSQIEQHSELKKWIEQYLARRLSPEYQYPHQNYIFVPLQDERDTNITLASPSFAKMNDLVKAISSAHPNEQIIVRRHPKFMEVEIDQYPNVIYDESVSYYQQIQNAKCVMGINSTIMLESLLFKGKKIYTLGTSLASNLNVYHEITHPQEAINTINDPLNTETQSLREKLLSELIFRRFVLYKDLERFTIIDLYKKNPIIQEIIQKDKQSLAINKLLYNIGIK